ncbi:MAG TPA: small ribosomal subunit Rsm22 family protein [Blastocatellia bacterium]|nr:small ribosomal subunit Rsm22 family protein [Blastocatellia bacterium]
MRLPTRLQAAIEHEASGHSLGSLAKAAAELSDSYRLRQQGTERLVASEAQRIAYAVVRLPATFAAVQAVFAEIRRLMPELCANSLLDLGAGPGTAAWAATEVFPEVQKITLIERDVDLIRLGRGFAQHSEHAALRDAEWQAVDLRMNISYPRHDLVVCSYSLGEIDDHAARNALKPAWQAATQVIAIIEPGTTKGFSVIRMLRDELIQAGGHPVAPCPHEQPCPMAGGDWCHFSQRFERSSPHRRIKGAELGYEDEKYSYIAAAKYPVNAARARVIRHPLRHSGYTQLQLCTRENLTGRTVTKKDKGAWKRARKTGWGDAWE